jgi:seryl-tRNA synthetase
MTITAPEPAAPAAPSPLAAARARLRAALLDDRVLLDLGQPGLYGRTGTFDRVFTAVDAAIVRAMARPDDEVRRLPPVEVFASFEATDYIASFPDLAGVLADARLALTPAVCHPLYATIGHEFPVSGTRYDMIGDAFRHEPSDDPMRMQAFHQHEWVHVGSPESARLHRDDALVPALELLRSFGLRIDIVAANDPFFGRVGQILARNQLASSLKFEFVTPVYGDEHAWTAIGSANMHEDHFGQVFDLVTTDGVTAHSSCIGFGLERVTVALFAAHGTCVDAWPTDVREALGL